MPLTLFFKMSRGGLLRDSLRLYHVVRARNLEQAEERRFVASARTRVVEQAEENQFLSGFEDEFVHAVDADLICPICKWALRSPILTSCGHRFCKGCIDELCKRLVVILLV